MIVLLVDDNPIDLMIHEKLVMKHFGESCEVVKMKSGQEALEYLSNGQAKPDITLLDIKMPIMSGFDFLEKIKGEPYANNLGIYMLSSSIDPKDIRMAEESPLVRGFLEKPLTFDTLNKVSM